MSLGLPGFRTGKEPALISGTDMRPQRRWRRTKAPDFIFSEFGGGLRFSNRKSRRAFNSKSEMGMNGQRWKAQRSAAFTPLQCPHDFVRANTADLCMVKRRERRAPRPLQNQLRNSGSYESGLAVVRK